MDVLERDVSLLRLCSPMLCGVFNHSCVLWPRLILSFLDLLRTVLVGVHRRGSQLWFQLPMSQRRLRDTPELQRIQLIRSHRTRTLDRLDVFGSSGILQPRRRYPQLTLVGTGSAPSSSVGGSKVLRKQRHKVKQKLAGLYDRDSSGLTQSGDGTGKFSPGSVRTRRQRRGGSWRRGGLGDGKTFVTW